MVDRGGLLHVSDNIYDLFVAMEVELRSHLRASRAAASVGLKEKAISAILGQHSVLEQWTEFSKNWGKEESEKLLRMIVELWITVRGFSFTSAFMEAYKQKNRKTTQKSKGLRKNLMGKSTRLDEVVVETENMDD